MSNPKLVYFFGSGEAEGEASMRNLLGGKGANLAEMNRIGLPVPAGFTITTEVCAAFYSNERKYPEQLTTQVNEAITKVEKVMKARFGDAKNPLLMSVRSGARASMPGMMDTVLNLGLNDTTVEGLIKQSGDARFGYDSYRRFITMYANVVLGLEHHHFEEMLQKKKISLGKKEDTDLDANDWKELVVQFKSHVRKKTGKPFPEDPQEQLWGAISAVFSSWMIKRAITYRQLNGIPDDWGTAVNVQAMVFGNMGKDCATGVAFSRNPSSGDNNLYGEYLINAQGEDVVAGIRTPQQITIKGREEQTSKLPSMEESMPEMFKEFATICNQLERHYRDMQDIEFTIQNNKLWILQTRNGKRTTKAGIKVAVDMANESLISREEAISRVAPSDLDQLLHPAIDPKAERHVLTQGLPASPGAASGQIFFTADEAEFESQEGNAVILVRDETSPEDIHGMHAAKGIVTARGCMTSHAAVVARGMGRPCVSGCSEISLDFKLGTCTIGGTILKSGDWMTIDGTTGEVMSGQVATLEPQMSGEFAEFMRWGDDVRRMDVRTNADNPHDAEIARHFGAEGIGLCRTEHMFFEADRIVAMREMILANDVKGRRKALNKILPMQRGDFEEIFYEMRGLPVNIRLLDPPLHEFVPHELEGQKNVAAAMELPVEAVTRRVEEIREFNPMMGHRGCRLGITFPEIYEMQVQAVIEAAISLKKKMGLTVVPEIMIPLVSHVSELSFLRKRCEATAEKVIADSGIVLKYLIGTMIELPRAALRANVLAQEAEFFSFGTNDLTQSAMGISRDDSTRFLPEYIAKEILERDPFASIDVDGVGELVRIGVERGRKTRPNIKLGICGEHGGDPRSIQYFESLGLDYISCSPYRVPIARLAAAQASLAATKEGEG
jgi:pyruvate, orthophosphate dikinase